MNRNTWLAKDYSPFTPGLPVPVELFVGRQQEVNLLRQKVAAATTGQLQVAFLLGERGIGKSSLAAFVRHLVERELEVLGLHTFLGGVTSLTETVRRIFDGLVKESEDKAWFAKVKELFGDHVRRVGLFGVTLQFSASARDLEELVHNMAPALRRVVEQLSGERRGLFLILDDINGLSTSPEFANWLKSLLDEIATTREPIPLCLLLVGLEERRHSLIANQPSLARVFDLVQIRPWTQDETQLFYVNAFSTVGISVDDDALDMLVRYAGGLPVLAHEIGDAVFKVDVDNRIDRQDALQGIVTAAEIVGRKHLEPQVFRAIRSARYRTILRKVAKEPFQIGFERSEVRSRLSKEEARVFDNFLRRMTELGVIVPDPERGRGAYRFRNLLHYLYFWLEAERAKQSREP